MVPSQRLADTIAFGKRIGLAVVFLMLLGIVWPGASRAEPAKYALLIGINQYSGKEFIPLTGCLNDVELMRGVLSSPRFGFKPENITLLTDDKASHLGIQAAFEALAARLAPGDIAYIHYAGHGSSTCDLSGDDPTGVDQTLVGYGSRSDPGPEDPTRTSCDKVRGRAVPAMPPGKEALNDYDVLDKELHAWLTALGKKTDNVIFVSDSCHSGTNTRGARAMATRGASPDTRPYPLAAQKASADETARSGWLAVAAARDEESSSEYQSPDGAVHGAFTWFWAQALTRSGPQDTWGDVLRRTTALLDAARIRSQHPQMEGERNRQVFGGRLLARPKTFTVQAVSDDGATATIDAGELLGVGEGSTFRKYDPQATGSQGLPTLTVTETTALTSTAKSTGPLQAGDAVVLERWQPQFGPQKVFLRAEAEADKPVVAKLTAMLRDMPALTLTDDQGASDIVLWVLRPQRDAQGKAVYAKPGDSLPAASPEAAPEVWALDAAEHPLEGEKTLKVAATEEGLAALRQDLMALVRTRGLLSLTPPPGEAMPVEVTLRIYAPVSPQQAQQAQEADKKADIIRVEEKDWKLESTCAAKDLSRFDTGKGERVLIVSVDNQSPRDLFIYGIDITPASGHILAFLPQSRYAGDNRVAAGQSRNFSEYSLILSEPTEYVRILASARPLDISVVEQDGYSAMKTRSADRRNPLEALLAERAATTRGRSGGPAQAADWTTLQSSFVKR